MPNGTKVQSEDDLRPGSDIGTRGFEIGEASAGATHFLIANKFCFARPHLMFLTSDGYQRQHEALHEPDFAAAWNLLHDMTSEYVAFYNCGKDGGCSRLHKHIQLMPKPKNCFASFLDGDNGTPPSVPFQWFYRRFESPSISASQVTETYNHLLQEATKVGGGHSAHADEAPAGAACPHNMILTRNWIVVIPRRRAAINKEAGVNALGMLGVIAVATQKEIDNWIKLGLTESLRELGVPKAAE